MLMKQTKANLHRKQPTQNQPKNQDKINPDYVREQGIKKKKVLFNKIFVDE